MARKKWKTVSHPTFTERRHGSQKAAYEYISEWRERWQAGTSRVSSVTVYVDEGDGRGWRTFERLNFAAEARGATT